MLREAGDLSFPASGATPGNGGTFGAAGGAADEEAADKDNQETDETCLGEFHMTKELRWRHRLSAGCHAKNPDGLAQWNNFRARH